MKIHRLIFILCLALLASCSSSSPDYLAVRVIDDQGRVLANVAVVMGGPDGIMAHSRTTDARGLTSFESPPANAVLAAAYSCIAGSTTFYSVNVIYGVNIPVVTLVVHPCAQVNETDVNFNVTNAIPGSTQSDVTVGPITYGGTQPTFDVSSGIQSDGNFSAFATAYDDVNNVLGYGFALDQPALAGSTVNMTINRTDFVRHTHQFTNVPPASIQHFAYTSLLRKRAQTNMGYNFLWSLGPLPASMDAYSFAGFADNNMLGAAVILLGQDAVGNYLAEVGFIRYLKTVSNQTFDFSQVPALPADLLYVQGASGRPVISWTINEPSAVMQFINFDYQIDQPQRVVYQYAITVPPGTGTILFPLLPDALAAYRPAGYTRLSLQTIKFDTPIAYSEYLGAFTLTSGAFWEVNPLSRYQYVRYERDNLP